MWERGLSSAGGCFLDGGSGRFFSAAALRVFFFSAQFLYGVGLLHTPGTAYLDIFDASYQFSRLAEIGFVDADGAGDAVALRCEDFLEKGFVLPLHKIGNAVTQKNAFQLLLGVQGEHLAERDLVIKYLVVH